MEEIADVTCNWTSTHVLLRQDLGSSTHPRILNCGSNGRCQLGNNSKASIIGDEALSSVDLEAVLQSKELASPTSKVLLEKLVSGSEHSLLLVNRSSDATMEAQVWGWGWNEHGNLAQGPQ